MKFGPEGIFIPSENEDDGLAEDDVNVDTEGLDTEEEVSTLLNKMTDGSSRASVMAAMKHYFPDLKPEERTAKAAYISEHFPGGDMADLHQYLERKHVSRHPNFSHQEFMRDTRGLSKGIGSDNWSL